MDGQSVICKHGYPDQNCCPRCELGYTKEMANAFMDERNALRSQLAEAKASIAKQVEAKDKACAALMNQLAEAKASAEAWQENCRMTEDKLEKERDRHADIIGKIAKLAQDYKLAILENAALREEVEKIREANRQLAGAAICPDHLNPENVRKQAAREMLDLAEEYEGGKCELYDLVVKKFGLEG